MPAPAAAHGFTYEIFCDDFTSLSTIDLGDTRVPGFKWYIQGAYNTTTNPADFAIVPGGLQLTPDTNLNPEGLYNFGSCAGGGGSGMYVGNTFQGGMYVDIKLTTWGDHLNGNFWWPAAWMDSVNQLYLGPPPNFYGPEIDFIENLFGGRALHSWYNGGSPHIYTTYASTPLFTSGNSYGVLILKPEQNGGTGKLEGYLNDVVEASSTPVTWSPGGDYSSTSELPLCIVFTAGYNQSVVIRSVQVFTTPPPSGGGRPRRGLR